MTPWLDPAQLRSWRALVEGSLQLLDRLDRHLREDHGLSLAEYEILVRISERPGQQIHMSDLAAQVSHSRARVSQTVDRLTRAGLTCRTTCPVDRRGVHAGLTPAGAARLTEAAEVHVTVARRLVVDVLSAEELTAVGDAMAKVRTATEEPAPGPTADRESAANG